VDNTQAATDLNGQRAAQVVIIVVELLADIFREDQPTSRQGERERLR
jgi:hypothetical protein